MSTIPSLVAGAIAKLLMPGKDGRLHHDHVAVEHDRRGVAGDAVQEPNADLARKPVGTRTPPSGDRAA